MTEKCLYKTIQKASEHNAYQNDRTISLMSRFRLKQEAVR